MGLTGEQTEFKRELIIWKRGQMTIFRLKQGKTKAQKIRQECKRCAHYR